ncbi:MAG: 30S ribosomal protein S6 [Proteobacteria bacterium]|nr:30S ribosomal protein S6 [Pseudomonadota bacterium]
MRRYETIFIINPDLPDEERAPLFERLKLLIPQLNGFLVAIDEWGTQKLAYEIKKKARGYYVRLDYCGTGPLVDEIERFFRIDDRVLKYMTIIVEQDVDIERLKEEMAQAETQKAQPDLPKVSETEPNISEDHEPVDVNNETLHAEND